MTAASLAASYDQSINPSIITVCLGRRIDLLRQGHRARRRDQGRPYKAGPSAQIVTERVCT